MKVARISGAAVALGGLLSFGVAGCNEAARVATADPASWRYVTSSWGGMAVGDANVSREHVVLPYRLGIMKPTHLDSAICPGRSRTTVEPGRVLVQLDRELCSSDSKPPRVIEFERPSPGKYVVAYNDADAGFPQLGLVEIR